MPQSYRDRVARALSLQPADLIADLPLQWVSTGLKYLIVPVKASRLADARIATASFGELLDEAGAILAYVLDPDGREGRSWVNDGMRRGHRHWQRIGSSGRLSRPAWPSRTGVDRTS